MPTVAFRSLLLLLTHQLRVLNSQAAIILPAGLWRFPNTTIRGWAWYHEVDNFGMIPATCWIKADMHIYMTEAAVERGSRCHRPTQSSLVFLCWLMPQIRGRSATQVTAELQKIECCNGRCFQLLTHLCVPVNAFLPLSAICFRRQTPNSSDQPVNVRHRLRAPSPMFCK